MIPTKKNQVKGLTAKYGLLEYGDIIEKSDEYYNPFYDEWITVDKEFIGHEFIPDESKPVRRIFK